MSSLDELTQLRRGYIAAARENDFEDGLRRLLSDLYPDNAHFVYELLQNAEDADATDVAFELTDSGLRVTHDGRRPFSLDDVKSITGIGNSPKADDDTAIGKFGVGFKAVFAYTQNPEVRSGDFSFVIRDLFVPEPAATPAPPGKTEFWFPFDRPEKSAAQAAGEVEDALRALSRDTLLFLANIRSITCTFPNADDRLLERRNLDERIVEIDSVADDDGPAHWYRIGGSARVGDKDLPVAAAFPLTRRAPRPGEPAGSWAVDPNTTGQVFIYFPAVKETSRLKFHVHGAFASTVARDSIRDDPDNDALLERIGELIVADLPRMLSAGLITDNFLQVLPNSQDELPDRYETLRTQILDAFNTTAITPTTERVHAPAIRLLRSVPVLRAAITTSDAARLLSIANRAPAAPFSGWLPDREQRARQFLDSLDAVDFAADELSRIFSAVSDAAAGQPDKADLEAWSTWLDARSAESLRVFYLALGSMAGVQSRSPGQTALFWTLKRTLQRTPLIRVRDGSGFDHVASGEAYLPTVRGLKRDRLVPDELAVFHDSTPRSGGLTEFYELAGVGAWDASAALAENFDRYADRVAEVTAAHLSDLRTLAGMLADGSALPEDYEDEAVFVGERADGTMAWFCARALFIDTPHEPTGLKALYNDPDYKDPDFVPYNAGDIDTRRSPLSDQYMVDEPDVVALAIELGARTGPTATRTHAWNNPGMNWSWTEGRRESQYTVNRDWRIADLDAICANGDPTLSRTLWNFVANLANTHAVAIYQANRSSPQHTFDSQLALALRDTAWILDQDGNLRTPAEMTASELADGLHMPANSELLRRAGFGRIARQDQSRREDDDRRARELGLESADVLYDLVTAYQRDPELFRELASRTSLPEDASASPDDRAHRARDDAKDTPRRRYEQRTRSTRVEDPSVRAGIRALLRAAYTNQDAELVCQVCVRPMPFKLADGSYYFETIRLIDDEARELSANHLALCPTCAAMYQHARQTTSKELRARIADLDIGTQSAANIDVILAGRDRTIRLTGKHAIDLQAALDEKTDDAAD